MNTDMQIIKKEAEEILKREDIEILDKEAQAVVVKDLETLGKAGDVLKIIKAKIFYLDEERKRFTKPLDDVKKQIMAQFKPQIEKCEKVKAYLEGKMFEWQQTESKRLEAEGDYTPIEAKGDIGKVVYYDNWKYEIIDESLVPIVFKSSDNKKIKAAIGAGKRELPGIRIYNEPYTVSR